MKILYMDKNVCFAKLERKFKLLELCPFKKSQEVGNLGYVYINFLILI